MKSYKKTTVVFVCVLLAGVALISAALVFVSKSRVIFTGEKKALEGVIDKAFSPGELTEDDIDAKVKEITQKYATLKETESVENGDVVSVDYKLKKDEGSEVSKYGQTVVVGKGYFSTEAEKAMIGRKAGESFDVSTVHNGDGYFFEITILSVKRYEYPGITDEFVKENFNVSSTEELMTSLKSELALEKTEEAREKALEEIAKNLIGGSVVFLTKKDLTEVFEYLADYYVTLASAMGMDVYTYADLVFSMNREEFADHLLKESREHLTAVLVCEKIAAREGIEQTEEAVQEYCERNGLIFDNGTPDSYHAGRIVIRLVTEHLLNSIN